MKLWGVCCLSIVVAGGVLSAIAMEAVISQDDVELDLSSGELTFNGASVDHNGFGQRVQSAYSIRFQAGNYSPKDGAKGVEDLFGPKLRPSERAWGAFPAQRLEEALQPIAAAEIDPSLIQFSAGWPWDGSTVISDRLVLDIDGNLVLNDQPVELVDVSGKLKGQCVSIISSQRDQHVNYQHLLSVAHALGSDVQIAELEFLGLGQVEVSAEISTMDGDGREEILTAPRVTTLSGNEALIRVVENASGMTRFRGDDFHQEDLGNLGVRFFVEPRIIGSRIKVSGVVIITHSLGKEEVFRKGDVPIYSYTTKKTVVPLSIILAPGETSKEFTIADIDGKPGMCKVSAKVVDSKGLAIPPSH